MFIPACHWVEIKEDCEGFDAMPETKFLCIKGEDTVLKDQPALEIECVKNEDLTLFFSFGRKQNAICRGRMF